MIGASSKPDPTLLLGNSPYEQETYGYSGRTGPVYMPDVLSQSTEVLLCWGQSQGSNVASTAHTVANAGHVFNVSLDNGAVYRAADPLLSCAKSGACVYTILGDTRVTNGHCTNSLLLPLNIGSSPLSAWQAGGVLAHRIGAACTRLLNLGVTPAQTKILSMIGESDHQLGTAQADIEAGYQSVRALFDYYGFSASAMWVPLESWYSGTSSATVRAAQAAVVDGSTILQGPDFDTMDNTYRDAGQTDFIDTGITQAAALWESSLPA